MENNRDNGLKNGAEGDGKMSGSLVNNGCSNNLSGGGKRLYGLDVFRILLVIEILMFHSNMHLGCSYGKLTDLFLRAGAVTMTAFFILSGFVNQYAFSHHDFTKPNAIGKFYIRRCINILPSYYFVAIIFCLFLASETFEDQLLLLPTEALTLQSIFSSLFTFSHNGGTWFISCIMICYFLFPLLNQLIGQLSIKAKLIWLFILTALLFYCPVIVLYFETASIYTNPIIRCFEYALGMILASMMNEGSACRGEGWPRTLKIRFTVGYGLMWIVGVVLLLFYMYRNGVIYDYMIYSIFFLPIWLLLIFLMCKVKIEKNWQKKVIGYLSTISYDMFLVQFFVWPIVRAIANVVMLSNATRIGCVFIVCFGLSVLLHEIFEKPVQKRMSRRLVAGKAALN